MIKMMMMVVGGVGERERKEKRRGKMGKKEDGKGRKKEGRREGEERERREGKGNKISREKT